MFTLPDLPYDYQALEPFIDAETMHLHHEKHHAAYVKNLNDALATNEDLLNMDIGKLIANLSVVPEAVRTKVRNNGGGHFNHSLFWTTMRSPVDNNKPNANLLSAINSDFGTFDQFVEKFSAAGIGRFGSGWVWLVSDNGNLLITDTPNQDSPIMEGKSVILGLDVWEHAYYLKYKNVRADYIKAWWNVVNWDKAEELYNNSQKVGDIK